MATTTWLIMLLLLLLSVEISRSYDKEKSISKTVSKEGRNVPKNTVFTYGPGDGDYVTPKPPKRICPLPCFCQMKRAYCDSSELKQLPRGLPSDTQYLNAKDNRIRKIKEARIGHMIDLQQVNMRGNLIRTIEPFAFRNMAEMRSLTLRDNKLRLLEPDTFKGLYSLEQLSLRNNRMRSIEHIFNGLTRLNLLSLGDNKIRMITDETFRTNVRLRVLDMHNNSISFIHRYSFMALPFLKYLILRDNPVKHVDLDFKLSYHLELIDFTNCKLKEVVQGLPLSIRDLRMSENRITELKDTDFKRTKKIRFLLLSENKIKKIQNNTFAKLWMLYDLHLSNNSIHAIPEKLPPSLHGFFAMNNSIHHVPDTVFQSNKNMEFLYLNHNKIKSVGQQGFNKLSNLRSLDLSSNEIHHLRPRTFGQSNTLELLDLSNNPIQEAEHNCFEGLENLHILQLSSVKGSSRIKPSIFKDTLNLLFLDLSNSSQLARHLAENSLILNYIGTVQDLNLMEDNLHGLPADFPNHFPQLKSIKLIGNPWHCDRSIFWLTVWLQNQSVEFFHQDKMICESPPEMKGRLIGSLQYSELPTVSPPNPDYKAVVDIMDIPFTHGKNVTIYIGGDGFNIRNDSIINISVTQEVDQQTTTEPSISTSTTTAKQPTTSIPLPVISKAELLKKFKKPSKKVVANHVVPPTKAGSSNEAYLSHKRRPIHHSARGFRVKQINGRLPLKDEQKTIHMVKETHKTQHLVTKPSPAQETVKLERREGHVTNSQLPWQHTVTQIPELGTSEPEQGTPRSKLGSIDPQLVTPEPVQQLVRKHMPHGGVKMRQINNGQSMIETTTDLADPDDGSGDIILTSNSLEETVEPSSGDEDSK